MKYETIAYTTARMMERAIMQKDNDSVWVMPYRHHQPVGLPFDLPYHGTAVYAKDREGIIRIHRLTVYGESVSTAKDFENLFREVAPVDDPAYRGAEAETLLAALEAAPKAVVEQWVKDCLAYHPVRYPTCTEAMALLWDVEAK